MVCICKFDMIEGWIFFFEDDDSGITVGLLKVLHDYKLICWEIMAPMMV
jgi:hypothetical protein